MLTVLSLAMRGKKRNSRKDEAPGMDGREHVEYRVSPPTHTHRAMVEVLTSWYKKIQVKNKDRIRSQKEQAGPVERLHPAQTKASHSR